MVGKNLHQEFSNSQALSETKNWFFGLDSNFDHFRIFSNPDELLHLIPSFIFLVLYSLAKWVSQIILCLSSIDVIAKNYQYLELIIILLFFPFPYFFKSKCYTFDFKFWSWHSFSFRQSKLRVILQMHLLLLSFEFAAPFFHIWN